RALPQEWAASTHSENGEGVVRTRAALGSPSLRWKQRYRDEAGGCRPDLSGQPLTISEANERSVGAASCVVPSPRFIGVAAARQDRTLARNHLPQLAGVRSAAPPGQDLRASSPALPVVCPRTPAAMRWCKTASTASCPIRDPDAIAK